MRMARMNWTELLELCKPYHARFAVACEQPSLAQWRFLEAALTANAGSEVGQRYRFLELDSPQRFLDTVPMRGYGEMEAELAALLAGRATLCAESVVHSERTSGSTHRAKNIPYTAAGLAGFHDAVFPWLYDLARSFPRVMDGRVYWSVSPRLPSQADASDVAYLAPAAHLLPSLSAVPFTVSALPDGEEWRFWTAFYLAADADLAVVSVWSPTFLFPLLDAIPRHARDFSAILRGEWGGEVPAPLRGYLPPPNPARAAVIESSTGGYADVGGMWPRLALISCWADASSRRFVAELARRCPGVTIQPKGLLATEAAISVPIAAASTPVLAVNSGFFELRRPDGKTLLVHEWREGDEGVIVVTTRSGLWRYRTGDRVRVTGFWRSAPCIEFLGREGIVSDLCGEKLDEALVIGRLPVLDSLLAPSMVPGPHYALFLDAARTDEDCARRYAGAMDAGLSEIHHYALARRLGQLGPVQAVRVRDLTQAIVARIAARGGAPSGAIKPPALDGDPGWLAYFAQRRLIESAHVDHEDCPALP
jgi:hypothetical protein